MAVNVSASSLLIAAARDLSELVPYQNISQFIKRLGQWAAISSYVVEE